MSNPLHAMVSYDTSPIRSFSILLKRIYKGQEKGYFQQPDILSFQKISCLYVALQGDNVIFNNSPQLGTI